MLTAFVARNCGRPLTNDCGPTQFWKLRVFVTYIVETAAGDGVSDLGLVEWKVEDGDEPELTVLITYLTSQSPVTSD